MVSAVGQLVARVPRIFRADHTFKALSSPSLHPISNGAL